MISAIYLILNKVTNQLYIGSAVNIDYRWRKHKECLRSNRHQNSYLQNAWNKYGEESFGFAILELIEDKTKLIGCEQFWIDYTKCCNRKLGYNLSPTAGSPLGTKRTEEFKVKMSLIQKGKFVSAETRKRMSLVQKEAQRNRINWPHELGHKCKCGECREKRLAYGAKWRKENPMHHRKYYVGGKYVGKDAQF